MNSTHLPKGCSSVLILFESLFLLPFVFLSEKSSSCASIYIFLFLCIIIHILGATLEHLLGSQDLSQKNKNLLDNLYYALFGPIALCITILGAITGIINFFQTPNGSVMITVVGWLWFLIMMQVHIPVSIVAYNRFKTCWRYDKTRRLDTFPYHPYRDFTGIQEELMRDGQEMQEIRAGLLQADHEKNPLRNTIREKTCSICYADFEIGEKVLDVPNCLHTFHEECVAAWLKKNMTCPMCRGVVGETEQKGNIQQDLENGRTQTQSVSRPRFYFPRM